MIDFMKLNRCLITENLYNDINTNSNPLFNILIKFKNIKNYSDYILNNHTYNDCVKDNRFIMDCVINYLICRNIKCIKIMEIIGTISIICNKEILIELSQINNSNIDYIEYDIDISNIPVFIEPNSNCIPIKNWGIDSLNADSLWHKNYKGKGLNVRVRV